MTKSTEQVDREVEDLLKEKKYPGWNFLIGALHYQRKLMAQIGELWTKKQQRYLDDLERVAEEHGIIVPRE